MGSGTGGGMLRARGGPMARFAGGGGGRSRARNRGGRGFRSRGRGRGRGRGNSGPPSTLNAKAAGGDWSNVFNPEIFQAMKNAEEAGMLHGVKTEEDDNEEDSDSDEDRKGIGFAAQKPKTLAEEKLVKEATLANLMKMVEDEKVSEELKKAREEVEDTRYLPKNIGIRDACSSANIKDCHRLSLFWLKCLKAII